MKYKLILLSVLLFAFATIKAQPNERVERVSKTGIYYLEYIPKKISDKKILSAYFLARESFAWQRLVKIKTSWSSNLIFVF